MKELDIDRIIANMIPSESDKAVIGNKNYE